MRYVNTDRRKQIVLLTGFVGALTALAIALASHAASGPPAEPYHSPYDVAFSPDGRLLAASDHTAKALVLLDPASGKVVRQAALAAGPGAIAWAPDSSRLFVTEYEAASVAEINPADAKVLRRFPVGPRPIGLAVAAKRQLLLVANSALADLSAIDLATGKERARVKLVREPFWVAVSPDETLALVSNLLPLGAGTDAQLTASVSLIDLEKLQLVTDIKLPPNTTCIRQTAISADGKWAYAVHTVGRSALPATQLDRGWVNTNALSIIDLTARQLYATVLLDNLSEGAADPWGIALAKDGSAMWVTLAGIHQIVSLDLANLHRALAGQPPQSPVASSRFTTTPSIWTEIKSDPAKRANLVNDLAALYILDLIQRTPLPGKAPRGISLSPDGKRLAIGQYYTGDVILIDIASFRLASTIPLGPQRPADEVRRGEIVFHDASYSFQHWLSCSTCHPNHARADALNWDLPNDGIGNPKSAKSLLNSHLTPPMMWRGIRESMEVASAAGFRFAMFQPPPQDVKAIQAYIRSLKPDPSPYLAPNGQLSEKAKRGKTIFDSEKANCTPCHSGDQHTNLKQYDVGTRGEFDPPEHTHFDTPTLIELWRTAPYLHDGRAVTLQEVFTRFNPKDQHGATSHLSKEQIDDLAEYLLSL